MTIVEALATLPDLTAGQRRDLDLDTRWTWAIIRRGRKTSPPSVRCYHGNQDRARAAWAKLDVRQGWALLVDIEGDVVASQSGPSLRSRW